MDRTSEARVYNAVDVHSPTHPGAVSEPTAARVRALPREHGRRTDGCKAPSHLAEPAPSPHKRRNENIF